MDFADTQFMTAHTDQDVKLTVTSYYADGTPYKTTAVTRIMEAQARWWLPSYAPDPGYFTLDLADAKITTHDAAYLDKWHPGWQGYVVHRDGHFRCPECGTWHDCVRVPEKDNRDNFHVWECPNGHFVWVAGSPIPEKELESC